MKLTLKLVIVAILLSATHLAMAADEVVSRREQRIMKRIDIFNRMLSNQQDALTRVRIKRGIDPNMEAEAERIAQQRVADSLATIEAERLALERDLALRPDLTIDFNPIQIDSLLEVWRYRDASEQYENFFDQFISLDIPKDATKSEVDTIYKERLQALASPVSLPYNSIVRGYIDRYISPRYKLMSHIIPRAQHYFPNIEEELVKQGLPVELRAMPIIESALTITAVSGAGAMGLWQFMPSTGKSYGLEINTLVDERCDPYKSTLAACKFLKDLYGIYKDWGLVIAAYNCGPGNVNKAMARSGVKNGSYWDIYDFLPRETRGYLPAFIGASYAYAYHREHGIELTEEPLPLATDTITIHRILHLGQVAEVLDLPIEILRKLNPQYRRDIIPATKKSYTLCLPQRYISQYIEQEELIHAKDSTYLKEYVNPANLDKLRAQQSGRIHVVRSGDTLSGIAKKYGVTTKLLMSWNNLRNAHKLSIGQKLRVSR